MSDIGSILVAQYGLKQSPSDEQIHEWATIAETLMKSGVEREEAGKEAAKTAFPELFMG